MQRRPPRSTLTDTLFPYTTLFRSARQARLHISPEYSRRRSVPSRRNAAPAGQRDRPARRRKFRAADRGPRPIGDNRDRATNAGLRHSRPEERRAGKEWVSQCKSRWSPYHQNKKKKRVRKKRRAQKNYRTKRD